MGVAATVATKGLGPQDPTKKLAHCVDFLGQPLSRKLVFKNFGPEIPPSLILTRFHHAQIKLASNFKISTFRYEPNFQL